MKKRTRQHYVISPGVAPGMAFVSWDLGEDPYQRADDFLPEEDQPAERCEDSQRFSARAAKHLNQVWSRLVRQSLWRPARKASVSA